ncbi:MAG: hypothetical protein VCB42_00970 [Myxococcota bacterium]
MTPEGRRRYGFGLKIAAYMLAAYAVLLFLDGAKGNNQPAVILLFAAVAIRLVARRFDSRPPSD